MRTEFSHDSRLVGSDFFFPRQHWALSEVEAAFMRSSVVALVGEQGAGKSAIAAEIARRYGAVRLELADYMSCFDQTPYHGWDRRIFALIHRALDGCDVLILDDYVYLFALHPCEVFIQNGSAMRALRERVASEGKKLLLVGQDLRIGAYQNEPPSDRTLPGIYGQNDEWRGIAPTPIVNLSEEPLARTDLEQIASALLGPEHVRGIDFSIVRLQLGGLSLQQMRWVCKLLGDIEAPTAEDVIDIAERHVQHGNVRLSEVEPLEFAMLPGTEAIAEALETHVVLPFENPQKALELGLKAKRGVMLFGPPGTGKTSIGRALARRLKGKFFLIDGSLGTEPPHGFIARVQTIIDKARENAPSVLFIDDADQLFAIPHVAGLARLLLTILDGIESESASKICVMMTVMDAMKVPEALLRSGRVELWLEMTPPDEATRARMFERWAGQGLPEGAPIDFAALAAASERFTPADIRRVTEDAKLYHASDIANATSALTATDYLMAAVRELAETRNAMAGALGEPRLGVGKTFEGAAI